MTQKFPLFFLNIDTVLSISNWIRSMKVETVQPHFLSNVFSLLSSRSFATMTRWCNNFSPLMTKDNCNGLFFGMQMHLEKKPLMVFCDEHLCYAFYAFIWVKTLIVLHCLVLIACLIYYWCSVLNSRCFIFLFSVDLFWIMFHPLIPRTNKRWVLLLWFI